MNSTRQRWARWPVAVLLTCIAPISGGVGTGGTGLAAMYVGTVAPGPGIVVNGTSFDAADARITINGVSGFHPEDLRPGMVARISGRVNQGTSRGDADDIRASRVVRGRVLQVGTGGTGLLEAGGLTISTNSDTVLDGLATVGDVAEGDTLDVYGYVDDVTRTVHASRIELAAPQSGVEIRGIVTAVDASTFLVDGLLVQYAGAMLSGFSGTPEIGDRVVVHGNADAGGIVASVVEVENVPTLRNGTEAEIEGAVIALDGQGSYFVDGIEVDATHAAISGGTLAGIGVGRVIHVEGTMVDNVLRARSIELENPEAADVDGPITSFVSLANFVVGGKMVDGSRAQIVGGSAADLRAGLEVSAVGQYAGKQRLVATRIVISKAGRNAAEVEGRVTRVDAPGQFLAAGTVIDARSARVRGAPLAAIRVGSRVQATGAWSGKVLFARELEIEP